MSAGVQGRGLKVLHKSELVLPSGITVAIMALHNLNLHIHTYTCSVSLLMYHGSMVMVTTTIAGSFISQV